MQRKGLIGNKVEKLIVKVAKGSAEREANMCCMYWGYQPKEPESLKKLRDFEHRRAHDRETAVG